MAGPNSVWSGDVTVAASDLQVHYRVPSVEGRPGGRLTQLMYRATAAVGLQPKVLVRACAGISLVARHGESIGIIGTNGSGKSTLLRVIAGLETPTSGTVVSRSAPVLLGVNAALVGDLSGLENARLGCLAMGLSPEETERAIPGILDLSGLEKAVYLPMRTYSAGMASRLRFAIATASNPEILMIDEALSTGDAAFKARSEARMNELLESAGTVFLVSHAPQVVEEMCTRAIWLHRGRVVLDGPAEETTKLYRLWAWHFSNGDEAKAKALFAQALDMAVPNQVRLAEPKLGSTVPRHARPR